MCNNIIPRKIQNIAIEEDLDSLGEEIGNDLHLEKWETKTEAYQSIKKLKYPQEWYSDFPIVSIFDDLNVKEMIDRRIQAMFKRSRHANISFLIISQD